VDDRREHVGVVERGEGEGEADEFHGAVVAASASPRSCQAWAPLRNSPIVRPMRAETAPAMGAQTRPWSGEAAEGT